MTDEKTLLEKVRNGDENATTELIKLYKPIVLIIARKYFLTNATTDDLIQEGMIGLFKAIRNYNPYSQVLFKTFASLLIKRQIQTALYKSTTQKNLPMNTYLSINNQGKILLSQNEDEESEENDGFFITSNNLTPEENILFKEKITEFDKYINELLSIYEKKVLQFYVKGLNYVEIAEILKKEPKSIDNALRRIKIKLRVLKV